MFDPEKECKELQEDIESEEDPWAGTGMDDDEETLPKDQHVGKEAGGVWGKTKKDDNCQSEDPTGSPKTTVRYLCSSADLRIWLGTVVARVACIFGNAPVNP